MFPAAFPRVQDSGSAGMRVSDTTSRCSGPAQAVLGTICLFHVCFSHFQALSLLPSFSFPSCTIHLLSYISLLLVQHPTALPISPRRCDLYLDSCGRSRDGGGGRPAWAEPTPQTQSPCCPSHRGWMTSSLGFVSWWHCQVSHTHCTLPNTGYFP